MKSSKQVSSGTNGLVITTSQIYLIREPFVKTKAIATIVLNDQLKMTGIRIVEGSNGLYVAYPIDSTNQSESRSVFYPLTASLRDHVELILLKQYKTLNDTMGKLHTYNVREKVGKANHVVSYHDGIKKYTDGSKFYDVHICNTKVNLAKFLKELAKQGYSAE